jgi:type III pantothenate kinase
MPPATPLLALDQGNSRLKAVLWEDELARARAELPTEAGPEAWEQALIPLLGGTELPVALASVVPARAEGLEAWLQARGRRVRRIEGDTPVPFPVAIQGRQSLGADRLCNAARAWSLHLAPALILDAGTALTVDVIDGDGCFAGGVIFPGEEMVLDALSRGASRLPRVAASWPATAIGVDTASALAAGSSWGLLGAAQGLVRRLRQELCAAEATVVLTGGQAPALARHWGAEPVQLAPDWTLAGLRDLAAAGCGAMRG